MELRKEVYEFGGLSYLVCPNGDIYGPSGKKLKQRTNDDGYLVVTMGKSSVKRQIVRVHRVVAESYLPNNNNLSDVDHMDGNRANPNVENLEWCSHRENVQRAYHRGHHIGRAVGEKNPRAHLTEKMVLQLRAEYRAGVTIQEMCDKYGYPWTTVSNAVKYVTWKHLP